MVAKHVHQLVHVQLVYLIIIQQKILIVLLHHVQYVLKDVQHVHHLLHVQHVQQDFICLLIINATVCYYVKL